MVEKELEPKPRFEKIYGLEYRIVEMPVRVITLV